MSLRERFDRMVDPLLERISVRDERDGLILADISAEHGDESGIEVLHRVLDVLANSDPRRYQRVIGSLRAVTLVKLGPYYGIYRHGSRSCLVNRTEALERSAVETAGAIVHEATHARLNDLGFGYESDIRDRIERLCSREQLRFLHRANAPGDLRETVEQSIAGRAFSDQQLLVSQAQILEANGWHPRLARVILTPRRFFAWWRERVRDPV